MMKRLSRAALWAALFVWLGAACYGGPTRINLGEQAAGILPDASMPALTGDVTNTAGTVAVTVGMIGGKPVTLSGAFSTSGAYALGFTLTGATSLTLPTTGTLATLGAQTFTGAQTFPASGIRLKGSSTGLTTFASANAGATNYTITFPASTDTVTTLAASQTLTNKTISGSSNTLSNIPTSSLTGTLAAAQEPAHTGDCTNSAGSVSLTCTKTNGTAFGTAATKNTGTSGATVPILNGTNTWSGVQNFASGWYIGAGGGYAMGFNAVWNGSGWQYVVSDAAYFFRHAGTSFMLNVMPVGTAGATGTPVAAITVSSAGAVTIPSLSSYVANEAPSGALNGSNKTFTLAYAPQQSGAALDLKLNGVTLLPTTEYSISGATITMVKAPYSTDTLRAYYFK